MAPVVTAGKGTPNNLHLPSFAEEDFNCERKLSPSDDFPVECISYKKKCIDVLDVTPTHIHEDKKWEYCITFYHHKSLHTYVVYRRYKELKQMRDEAEFYLLFPETSRELEKVFDDVRAVPFPKKRFFFNHRPGVAYERANLIKSYLEQTVNLLFQYAGKSEAAALSFRRIIMCLFRDQKAPNKSTSPQSLLKPNSTRKTPLSGSLSLKAIDEEPDSGPVQYA